MRIGEMAQRLGTATHTLRHWEDVGVLIPARSQSGHRVYTDDALARARLILVCQQAGLSLADIRLLSDPAADRKSVITAHRNRIRRDLTLLTQTDRFLGHVLQCRHPLIEQCSECTKLTSAAGPFDRTL